MNTKQIIAVMAIVAVAVAGVAGVAYAYQATLTDEGNFVDSHYLELNGTDDFEKHFTNSNVQWSSETYYDATSTSTKMKVTPVAANGYTTGAYIAGNLSGVQCDADFPITINSTTMENGNWFKFNVQTVRSNTTTGVDLQGAYVLKYVYTDGTRTWTDYTSLNGTAKIGMFVADARAAATAQKVTITLYAVEKDGLSVGSSVLDYSLVDFVFTAETMETSPTAMPATGAYSFQVQNASGTKIESLTVEQYELFMDGARICGSTQAVASGVFSVTAPSAGTAYTMGVTAAAAGTSAPGYHLTATTTPAAGTPGVGKDTLQGIEFTTFPTDDKRTFKIGTTVLEDIATAINTGTIKAIYATPVADVEVTTDAADVLTFEGAGSTLSSDAGTYELTLSYTDAASTTKSTTIWVVVTE